MSRPIFCDGLFLCFKISALLFLGPLVLIERRLDVRVFCLIGYNA